VIGLGSAVFSLRQVSVGLCPSLSSPTLVQAPSSLLASVSVLDKAFVFVPKKTGSSFFLYSQCDGSLPTPLCSSSPANVSVSVKASTLKLLSPAATTTSWAAGTKQNISFSHTLGAGSEYMLSATGAGSVAFGTAATSASTLSSVVRMSSVVGNVTFLIVPVGQPLLNVTRASFALVAPQITVIRYPTKKWICFSCNIFVSCAVRLQVW
jgi:hypothetical protein